MQSSDGFQCPYTSSQPSNDLELGHLVLASERTTYSQAEIAQMSAYLAYYVRNGGVLNGKVLRGGTQPPPTLRWALGGEPGGLHSTTGTPIGIPGAPPPLFVCGAELTLTNTGNTPIQITKVGVQLKARPQQNTYQYRLIDACSLDISSCVILGSGGGGDCSVYSASIQLGPGKQNDVFSAVPTASPGCSALTIPPNTQISLNLSFYPAAAIPQNLMYSIVPVLMVDTTQGEQTLAFSQLGSTLAFASANQFSCYALQGTTFVLERSPVFSLSGNPTPIPGGQHWCL